MQRSNLDKYVDYFRSLAVSHHMLQHNPLSELKDTPEPDKRFYKWDADEVIGGLRTELSFPALIIELYENQLSGASEADIRQRPSGAFTVIDHAKERNIPAQQAAYDKCEKIMMELLQQIWQDVYGTPNRKQSLCAPPFKEFLFTNANINPTGLLFQSHYGWRVEFQFEFQNNPVISTAPAEGTFHNYVVLGTDEYWLGDDEGVLGWQIN